MPTSSAYTSPGRRPSDLSPDFRLEIEGTLAGFARGVLNALEANFLALYVFGSYVTGDFVPQSSDLDFLGLSRRALSRPEALRLAALHERLVSAGAWGGRLEGGYAAREQIRPWGLDGSIVVVQPGLGLTPSTANDYSADNMLALREHGRALGGPPAAELVPPVERCVLEAALGDYLQDLLERPTRADSAGAGPTDAKLAEWLLNASRCLYGIRTGRLITKTGAARWLSEEQPALAGALQAALAVRSAPGCSLGKEGRAKVFGAFAALAGS